MKRKTYEKKPSIWGGGGGGTSTFPTPHTWERCARKKPHPKLSLYIQLSSLLSPFLWKITPIHKFSFFCYKIQY